MVKEKGVLEMAVIDLIDEMTPEQAFEALRFWDADLLLRLHNQMEEIGASRCASVLLHSVLKKVAPVHYRMVTEAAQVARG